MAFRLVEQYLPGTAKGACYLCRAALRQVLEVNGTTRYEHVLDTGMVIDFEGGLAVCESCIREGAQLLGLVDVAELHNVLAAVAEAKERVVVADAKAAEAIALAEAVVDFRQQRAAATEEPAPAKPKAQKPKAQKPKAE